MKVSELRKGNIVTELTEVDEVDEVSDVISKELVLEAYDIWEVEESEIYVEGIELTPKWLERMGFIDDSDGFDKGGTDPQTNWLLRGNTPLSNYFRIYQKQNKDRWKDKDVRGIELGEFMVYANQSWVMSVKTVHEFQNLYFALTSQELTIKELV